MEVEYEITLDDMVEFSIYAFKNNPQRIFGFKNSLVRYTVFSAILLLCGLISVLVLDMLSCGIFCFVASVLILLFYWYAFNTSQLKKRYKKAIIKQYKNIPNEEICRHKVSISETGVHASTDYGESTNRWSAISEIVRTDNYLYLFFKPGKAYVVTKRAFIDEAAFNRFVDTARMYHSKASVLK